MRRLRPHFITLGIALLIVASVGLLSYRSWNDIESLTRAAERARLVSDHARQLLSLVKDAEDSQRGFLLTGDDNYLATYRAALPAIEQSLAELTVDFRNSSYPPGASALTALVKEKVAELARTIELRRSGNLDTALAIVRTDAEKKTMEHLHALASELILAANLAFSGEQATAHNRAVAGRVIVLGGTAMLVVLLVLSSIQITNLLAGMELARFQEHGHKETLRTTLESIGDAVIATDAKGAISFMNPVAAQLTGWPMGEADGQPLPEIFRIISEDTRHSVDNPAAKVLRDGAAVGLANHTLLIARDGREIPIDDSGAPIKDPDGKIAGVVLVFRDISERRHAERKLAESAQRYQLLFEANPQPMWVYDQESLAFLAVNDAAVRNYEYTREEFLAMTLRDIRPQEDVAKLLEVTAVPTTGLNIEGPWRHRTKSGKIIIVEISEHSLAFDHRAACLVLANDITERQRLEQQFLQAQKLESIGRLAGGVAHDFNNLLTVINGYCEMLLAGLPPESPQQEGLTEILAAGNRAAALTQQLLAFSRRQVLQPAVLNLNLVVKDIQRMLVRLIGEDIQFITKLSPDLGNVVADSGHLQQVIMNLAVNARDAMPAGGAIIVETANVTFDDADALHRADMRPGSYVMLAVTDTGSGMSAEVKDRLFEPFFTTKPTGHGTGLGLATVYGMVKQSGGWIWVYSEPGSGTTFKVYFPRTDSALTGPQRLRPGDSRGTETILLVEDQPDVRNLAVRALRKSGYTVHSAGNGAEAISFADGFEGAIHLLVTDVVMPGMNGREVAEQLQRHRPTLRVLFMSGYTANVIVHRGVLDTGIDYLQKPFTPDLLAAKVREVLGPLPS